MAKHVGIRRLSTGHLSRAGDLLGLDVGLALAQAEGCHPEVLLGICEPMPWASRVDVVLWSDYPEAVRLAERLVGVGPRRGQKGGTRCPIPMVVAAS